MLRGSPEEWPGGKTLEISLFLLGDFPTLPDTVRRLRSSKGPGSTFQVSVFLSTVIAGMFLVGMGARPAQAAPGELGPFVFSEDVWETNIVDFYREYRECRFRWNGSKTVARFHGKRFPITAFGKRLSSVHVKFKDKRIHRMEVLAYDESVDGKITKQEFEERFNEIRDAIGVHSGRGNPGISVNDTETGTRREMWINDYTAFLLEYRNQSVKPQYKRQFRGDFIRLRTAPRGEASSLRNNPNLFADVVKARELKQNVSHVRSVRLIKNVPMVLQGDSSSGEAATAEMLFRYLNVPIDQREVAATMAAESAVRGPFHPLRQALNTLAPARVFNKKVLREFDWKSWSRLVNDYNMLERARGKPALEGQVGIGEPDRVLREMDLASLKRAIARTQSLSKFRNSIVNHVSRGVPLLWGVQLGIVEENGIPLSFFEEEEVVQPITLGRRGRRLASASTKSGQRRQVTKRANETGPANTSA